MAAERIKLKEENLDQFVFKEIHPQVLVGTASDRYAGWLGQIYSENRYKISRRKKKVGGKAFEEEVLPVESVAEYFRHFSILEVDFTFYRLLLDADREPTSNYRLLKTYRRYLEDKARIILKVPQAVFSRNLWRQGKFIKNSVGNNI